MKHTSSPRLTGENLTFYQSFLVGAGCWSCVLPVEVASTPDSSLWAAALDLRIEFDILRRILDDPEAPPFFYAHRLFVNLDVLIRLCPRTILADRARQLIANCLWLPHPIHFAN